MTNEIAVSFVVNGEEIRGSVEPRMTLADFLRDAVGLTGTHLGCEHGVCGACTILVNGRSARSCLMLAVQADGQELRTVEGLEGSDGTLHPVQEAFSRHHALQCGFCTPGFLMTVVEYLEEGPAPDERAIRERLSGNLCRCTGYHNIVLAVKELAEKQT
ncbi:MAG TPA: (2Fe-2S)-binding protein [Acidimicrobiia bacterium]|nr:(2Fe-2S)-binding protein [Acidimicrobiia bacterium]